jgi:hypothetical protein
MTSRHRLTDELLSLALSALGAAATIFIAWWHWPVLVVGP